MDPCATWRTDAASVAACATNLRGSTVRLSASRGARAAADIGLCMLQHRPTFEAPETIASLPEAALDQQPFGIIRLDRTGKVLSFNTYEERLARKQRADVLGKNFFTDVAPCTRVKEFHGKFLEGIEQRYLNTTFAFVFAFSFGHRGVHVSLYYKQADDTIWVLVRGES